VAIEVEEILLRSHYLESGGVDWIEVIQAPKRSRISMAVLVDHDQRFLSVAGMDVGSTVTIKGRPSVSYRIVGRDRTFGEDVVEVERVEPEEES
jgi:hypothetical protein